MAKRKTGKKAATKKKPATKPKSKATRRKTHQKVRGSKSQKKATTAAKKILASTPNVKPVRKVEGRVGRPSVLTPDLVEKITALLLMGSYVETACAACGLSKSLYYEWLKLGNKRRDLAAAIEDIEDEDDKESLRDDLRKIDPIYAQFSDAIEKALNEAELRDLSRIDSAAGRSWQAAAWKLERKYPERWSRNYKIEHSGEVDTGGEGPTIEDTRRHLQELLSDPESLSLAEKLMDRLKGDK